MAHYKFTDKAEQDLENIIDFTINKWGNDQANRYINELEKRVSGLANNPNIGLNRNNLSPSLLSFPYQSHILYYIKTDNGITIARVLHRSMDPTGHL